MTSARAAGGAKAEARAGNRDQLRVGALSAAPAQKPMREDAAFKKGIELGFARAAMPWAVGLVVCMDVTVGFDVKIWRQSKPMRRAQALIDVKSAEGLAIRPQNRALLFRIVR